MKERSTYVRHLALIVAAAAVVNLLRIPSTSSAEVAHQIELARQLESAISAEAHTKAFYEAAAIDPAQMAEPLRAALIGFLETLNARAEAAVSRTGHMSSDPLAELIPEVATKVAELNDPRSIRPLSLMGAWVRKAEERLVSFGESAAQVQLEILGVARPDTNGVKDKALRTLSLIVARNAPEGLSAATLNGARGVARNVLDRNLSDLAMAGKAMDLAVSLGDPELLARVKKLSSGDEATIRGAGISDPRVVNALKRRASVSLSNSGQ